MTDTRQNAAKAPEPIWLKDYTPPDYRVETIRLRFDLDEQTTTVRARLAVCANYPGPNRGAERDIRSLVLNGQDLELVSVHVDGRPLESTEFELDADELRILEPPENFELEIVTRIHPEANTALEGLYTSGGNFCTQCEAEGFRKITYFPDRPDVMSTYTTTLVADKTRYPVLLSNGDCIEREELGDGRHLVTWHDPFPKPCYLFALVAGDLARVEDAYETASGRHVALHLYVQHGNEDKCPHALRSLKKAMRWDEENYGREYDLDTYMIVAVNDFNMGAMENKGLNIFNSKFVLARSDTATDVDFVNIEAVIAHEYFHNWSGNRVTCRDWFQLSLKEGFTVFRDQQFTADMTSAAVKRIQDVGLLRSHQFPEDAGPNAHPVRPASYVEINNFYTVTVYEKGAEIVRMLRTLLGPEKFRRGSDLYFQRHDGQAVTTDDFVQAMEDASGVDLGQFRRWYSQAGTPEVRVKRHYDPVSETYRLTFKQSCPPTPGQPHKEDLHIPVEVSLLGEHGEDLPLCLEGEPTPLGTSRVLELTSAEQAFTFCDIQREPVPSILRGFSAPVTLVVDYTDEELAYLTGHDSDPFNRWEAGQQLAVRVLLRLVDDYRNKRPLALDPGLSGAFAKTLSSPLDPALIAEAITLPDEAYVAEFMEVVDPVAIHEARRFLETALATAHQDTLARLYEANSENGAYAIDAAAMGRRALKNRCLKYLIACGVPEEVKRGERQFREARNMTDVMAALTALAHRGGEEAEAALKAFHVKWRGDPLVLDKWFTVQATSPLAGTLEQVKALAVHPDFNIRNPNRVRSLIAAFCKRNPGQFHQDGGEAYDFLAGKVLELNAMNPQVAARLIEPLTHWRRFDEKRQVLMRSQLERVMASPSLSRDVFELVSKSLNHAPKA